MFRTLATLCILFGLSSHALAQTKRYYRYPSAAKKKMVVGGVTYLGGVRPYTPSSGVTRSQIGAVTYLGGVRPYTPNRGATRGQVGAVTYLGVRPYTPTRGFTRGQVGAVTYLGGYRQPQYRVGVPRGYIQPYRGVKARP